MKSFLAFIQFSLLATLLSLVSTALYASAPIPNPLNDVKIANFNDASIPHIELDIAEEAFNKLLDKRAFAIKQRMLERGANDYVPGRVSYNNEKYKVKLRLKGDYIEHLKGDKWSYRIKVKGGKTIMGMKTFSLQHPKMRLFLHEWTILKALQNEGLISLRYNFVKLSINGVYLGIYNIEEHFDKRLVENNQRREGPVFKFDEAALFDLIKQDIYDGGKHDTKVFMNAEILPFQKKKATQDPRQKELFEKGVYLLDAFRKGKAPASEVFNIEQMAKYYAISDVFMGKHGIRWHNQRFYFNPIDSKIEPIGYDFNDDKPGLDPLARINNNSGLFNGTNWAFDVFSRMIFSDPVFFEAYKRNADRIASKQYMDDFFKSIQGDAKKLERILKHEFNTAEFKQYIHFNDQYKKSYYDNQTYVRNALNKKMELKVHLKKADDQSMTVVYNNRDQHLLDIYEYRVGDKRYKIEEQPVLHTYRFYTPYVPSSENLYTIKIPTEKNLSKEKVYFRYRTHGGKDSWETPLITKGSAPGARRPNRRASIIKSEQGHPMRTPANWKEFPFFYQEGNKIIGTAGKWVLDKNIIFPSDKRIEFSAGMELDFKNGANIISFSPIDSKGSVKKPVILHSSDKTGGGIFVSNAKEPSVWQSTHISQLSSPSFKEWKPTGAVTFYKSPITILRSRFENNNAEDSLNTINTEISLQDNYFSGSTSDAYDADFCTGTMNRNTFENIGNDAVDVSGSNITIDDLTVNTAGDKGISVGERSIIRLNTYSVTKAGIGIASKDSSILLVDTASIHNATIGVCAYQKKPEYEPPEIHIKNLEMDLVVLPSVYDKKSLITVNNKRVVSFFGKTKKSKLREPEPLTKTHY